MAKRKTKPQTTSDTQGCGPFPIGNAGPGADAPKQSPRSRLRRPSTELPAGSTGALRVLVVEADARAAGDSCAALTLTVGADCVVAASIDEARRIAADRAFDVALIDLDLSEADAFRLARELTAPESGPAPRVVFTAREPGFDLSVKAIRCGAADLLRKPAPPAVLGESVRAAGEQARAARAQCRRVQRLKRMCRRLNSAREEVTQQVGGLCNELAAAYQDLAGQVEHMTMATEFSSLLRQELDVESLLRTTLEYLLTKTGPTNAAVFLPTGPREYSLGAYVNYDIPRETADVLLDHLADTLPQRFEEEESLLWSSSSHDLTEWMNDGAGWGADSTVIVFACRNRGECLGVATLFRDPSRPFTPEIIAHVELMRDLFTQQLARVINIHNRHKPKDAWPGFAEEDAGDDDGLAA